MHASLVHTGSFRKSSIVQSSDKGDLKQETQSMVIFVIRNDSSVRFLNMNILGMSKHHIDV